MRPLLTALALAGLLGLAACSSGPKPYDGAWAPHWYNAVHASTGFDDPEGPLPDLPSEYQSLVDQALPYYDRLSQYC